MSSFKLTLIVLVTAVVTAAVTSIFWIAMYSVEADRSAEKTLVETAEPVAERELVLGPSGIAIPVEGVDKTDLIDTYKQARTGGSRVHDAIDIMAPHGTPVVAAAPGTVEKLFLSKGGGGITAYVRSEDQRWIYYYAHLQDYAPGLEEGQKIDRGDPIGTVGSSGNANPEGPHLHFAVHRVEPADDWHGGTPVNPYPLLAGSGAGG